MSSFWRRVGLIHPAGVLKKATFGYRHAHRENVGGRLGVILSHTKEVPEVRDRGTEGTGRHSPDN